MVDDAASGLSAQTFVGEGRHGIVDGLLGIYDRVNAGAGPAWVSLEAPSGWGKTRIAHELYARLAASRQHDVAYWPPRLLDDGAEVLAPAARRKRVGPQLDRHAPGSMAPFFWWGIACSQRGGVPSDALAQDVSQLEAHQVYLEDAWRAIAKLSERYAGWWKAPADVLADEGLSQLVGHAVNAVAPVFAPGAGLVAPAISALVARVQAHRDRRRRLHGNDELTADSTLLDDTVDTVSRLARPGLPVVLFVEDFHLADDALAELVERCAASEAAVLLITTMWPGLVDKNPAAHRALHAAGDRLIRIAPDSDALPAPFPAHASLAPLAADDLGLLVLRDFPRAAPETVRALVAHYSNPFALELFCGLDSVRRDFPDGDLELSAEDIADLPYEVVEMYRLVWRELPEQVKRALSIAAAGVSAPMPDHETEAYLVWNADLALDAAAAVGLPDVDEARSALDDAVVATGWAHRIDEELRAFTEHPQLKIAGDDDSFLRGRQRRALRAALGESLAAPFAGYEDADSAEAHQTRRALVEQVPDEDLIYRARLALALNADGQLADGACAQLVLAATDALISGGAADAACCLAVAEAAEDLVDPSGSLAHMLGNRAMVALSKLGRFDEAAARGESRLAAMSDGDPNRTFEAVNLATAFGSAGRSPEAIRMLETVRGDVVSAANPERLRDLGEAYALAGDHDSAGDLLRAAVELRRSRGDVPDIRALASLAGVVDPAEGYPIAREAYDIARQIQQYRGEPLTEMVGPVFRTYASIQSNLGEHAQAREIYAELREMLAAVVPPGHPDLLRLAVLDATAAAAESGTPASLAQLQAAASALESALGSTAANVREAWRTLAAHAQSVGAPDMAWEAFERLWRSHKEKFGAESVEALQILGVYVQALDEHDALLQERLPLAAEHLRLCELLLSDAGLVQATTESFHRYARALTIAGQYEESIRVAERAAAAAAAAGGEDSPVAFQFRHGNAAAQLAAEDIAGAQQTYLEAAAAIAPSLGQFTTEALDMVESGLAAASATPIVTPELLFVYEALLAARQARSGLDSAETLDARDALAGAHLRLGHADEAIRIYEECVRIARRALTDVDTDRYVLEHNLGYAYEQIGSLDIARDIYAEAAVQAERALGPTAEGTEALTRALERVEARISGATSENSAD